MRQRIADKPADMVPSALGGFGVGRRAVARHRARTIRSRRASRSSKWTCCTATCCRDAAARRTTRSHDPAVRRRRGGQRGAADRPAARASRSASGSFQFSVAQAYDFQTNDAYSFRRAVVRCGRSAFTQPLSSRINLTLVGSGGLTVLGAIDSLPLGVTEVPEEEHEEPTGGQGVSEGPRFYDYGPGSKFSLRAVLDRDRMPFVVALLRRPADVFARRSARQSLPAARAPRSPRADLPDRSASASRGEYFSRHTYYQDVDRTEKQFRYPQFRAYLTWKIS